MGDPAALTINEVIMQIAAQIQDLQVQLGNLAGLSAALASQVYALLLLVKVKLQTPDTYNSKEDIELQIFQITQYLKGMKVLVHEQVDIATSFFREDATIWWRTTLFLKEQKHEDPPEWEELIPILKGQFQPVNSKKSVQDKLAQLRQTGSVKAYNTLFMSTIFQIDDLSQAEMLDRYIKNFKKCTR